MPSDGLFLKDMISEFGGEVGCRDKMEGSNQDHIDSVTIGTLELI